MSGLVILFARRSIVDLIFRLLLPSGAEAQSKPTVSHCMHAISIGRTIPLSFFFSFPRRLPGQWAGYWRVYGPAASPQRRHTDRDQTPGRGRNTAIRSSSVEGAGEPPGIIRIKLGEVDGASGLIGITWRKVEYFCVHIPQLLSNFPPPLLPHRDRPEEVVRLWRHVQC